MHEQQIVGQAVAGKSHEVTNKILALVNTINQDNFTLAEYLHEVKSKQFFLDPAYKCNTFKEYAKLVGVKPSKAYYLARIVEVMSALGHPREVYEPVGMSKLREITKLEPGEKSPDGKFDHTAYINSIILNPDTYELEDVISIVAEAQGKTGENKNVWWNVSVLWSTREQVIKPAVEEAKRLCGTVGTDADGMAKDISDGRALEFICADFLSGAPNLSESTQNQGDSIDAATEVGPEQEEPESEAPEGNYPA